jgi:hypothetical protein
MAVTKQDSIFPQIHLPGGISSKATEYKELATKGNTWESPIFKLGSAAPSTNIASAPKVTQKDHPVTDGGVRGPQNIGNTSSTTENLKDPSAQRDAQSANGGLSNGSTTNSTSTPNNFGSEVDHALNGNSNGKTGISTNGTAQTNGGTLFGAKNPVFSGEA